MNSSDNNNPDNRLTYLKQHINQAADQLALSSSSDKDDDLMGSLLYLGNHHDSIPRELITDPHLESGEIHVWMLMKIQVNNPALPTSIPSRESLMKFLKCSRPVLSRHLQVLRALRWVTLCKTVRGDNGQFKGYVYAQHDKPLNLADTLLLDPDYINFLQTRTKISVLKRLALVKQSVLTHVDYQVLCTDDGLDSPAMLEVASQHLSDKTITAGLDTYRACPDDMLTMQSESDCEPESDTETGNSSETEIENETGIQKPTKPTIREIVYMDEIINHVNNFTTGDSNHVNKIIHGFNHVNNFTTGGGSSYIYKKTTTTTTTKPNQQNEKLRFPKMLNSPRLKTYAGKLLLPLTADEQQFALNYLEDRIAAGKGGTCKPVTDVIGYLRWLVNQIQADTLPPSSYGIREEKQAETKKVMAEETPEEATRRFQAQMKRLGYAIDPKTRKPVTVN